MEKYRFLAFICALGAVVVQTAPSQGAIEPLIGGGLDVPEGKYKFMVALYINGSYECSATLISDRLVLTARHCIKLENGVTLKDFEGLVGDVDKSSSSPKIKFQDVHCYPGKSGDCVEGDYKKDLAVLVTSKPVLKSSRVRPVCLAKDLKTLETNQRMVAIGWGRQNEQEHLTQKEIAQYTWVREENSELCGDQEEDSVICASFSPSQSCKGDSGGPLLIDSSQPVQVGIISRPPETSISTPVCSATMIAVDVSPFSSYISRIAKATGSSSVCFV